MIYLLSQMILALVVATVLGVAFGWIIHRHLHNRVVHQFRHRLARQSAQLAQAEADVSMLSDDYDELRRQSQDEISALSTETRQIPSISNNLEKSQLLVQQMMRRHEAEVRDLNNEKRRLADRLAHLDKPAISENPSTNTDQQKAPSSRIKRHAHPPSYKTDLLTGKPTLYAAAESDEDPFDKVIEVGDEMQRELEYTKGPLTNDKLKPEEHADNPAVRVQTSDAENKSAALAASDTLDATSHVSLDASLDASSRNSLDDSLHDLSQESLYKALDDYAYESSNDTLNESSHDPLTSSSELSPEEFEFASNTHSDNETFTLLDDSATLFDPVNQQDDLQQIFGIGPITEKALNDLGITSYSQLAELKQHDIQRIADALDIGANRIERDNWVGNARRQLEEVLEQL